MGILKRRDRIIQRVNEIMGPKQDIVLVGNCEDFTEYKNLVGQLHGAKAVLDIVNEELLEEARNED